MLLCDIPSTAISANDDDVRATPTLAQLVDTGCDRTPLPGSGATLERRRSLARVAAQDLALLKLFEGHTDALAILAELEAPTAPERSRWGTWCAEPPQARLSVREGQGGARRLSGIKAWCSGADTVTHAIVSCWNEDGAPCLAAVALDHAGIEIEDSGWKAAGMRGAGTRTVNFNDVQALWVSAPNAYVQRPGFWQGSAGIAACWWGTAAGIGASVLQHGSKTSDPHVLAHLGAIDVALGKTAALLQVSAGWIDAHPKNNAKAVALRARIAVEDAAVAVMWRAGRAIGAGPLVRDEHLAQAMTDLPIFLRQSHAERDLATLGSALIEAGPPVKPWTL